MTSAINSTTCPLQLTSRPRVGKCLPAGCLLAFVCCGPAGAQQTSSQEQSTEEIAISAQRESVLENEAVTISETPDAGPHLARVSAMLGFALNAAPVYVGSKITKVSPFPYIDIRGLFDDRVFVSIVEGLGVRLLNDGPIRAGVAINYSEGRTSKDDRRLTGLPDISAAARVDGYLVYSFKPFVLETKVEQRLGSNPGTTVRFAAAVSAAPIPQLHLTLSSELTWASASYQKTFFGVTPAQAAQATTQGNPLPAYTPGSGLTGVSLIASGVYQVGQHWGYVARLGFNDIVGKPAKDSPLTQRAFAPTVGIGALYKF